MQSEGNSLTYPVCIFFFSGCAYSRVFSDPFQDRLGTIYMHKNPQVEIEDGEQLTM